MVPITGNIKQLLKNKSGSLPKFSHITFCTVLYIRYFIHIHSLRLMHFSKGRKGGQLFEIK